MRVGRHVRVISNDEFYGLEGEITEYHKEKGFKVRGHWFQKYQLELSCLR